MGIVSPSWAGPGYFPEVHETGMRVLRDELGLVPVEFPTTRRPESTPQDRAADLMAAFADPRIAAVLATIGGDDELTVLPYLDPVAMSATPKAFFGYSDNTNLLNWLWNLGIAGYHGGSTLVHLARGGGPHPVSLESLRRALFTSGTYELEPQPEFTDLHADWGDPATLVHALPMTPDPGWTWHQSSTVVTGPTWGGNLEVLHWNLAAGRWIRPVVDYEGCILLLETSEEMPAAEDVFRMLRNAGERGLLAQFPAIVVAKPKAWDRERDETPEQRTVYREAQREAVVRALGRYAPDAMVVIGPDFGHTDPQYVLPYGGQMTVDGPARRITYSV